MADNIDVTPGTGKTVAADDIAGVMHQRVKIGYGADGAATDVSSSTPMPVVIRNSSGTEVDFSATSPVSVAALAISQGGAIASVTGPMIQGSVTTGAPTYTTATVNPLSMTVAGGLRVTPSGLTASGGTDTTSNPILVGGKQFGTNTPYFLAVDSAGAIKATAIGGYNSTLPTISNGASNQHQLTVNGLLLTAPSPTTDANAAAVPSVTSAVANSLVLKASAGNGYRYSCANGASAGYLMVFNATSAPADGAVTPMYAIPVAANSFVEMNHSIIPDRFSTGITLVFSTTGPYTKTASATAHLAGTWV
jgi:hypothetical protein